MPDTTIRPKDLNLDSTLVDADRFIVDSTAEGTRSVMYKTIKDSVGEVTDSKIASAKSIIDGSINEVNSKFNSLDASLKTLKTDITYGYSEFVASSTSLTDIELCKEFLRSIFSNVSNISKKVIIVPWSRNTRGYFVGYVYPDTTQTDAGYPYNCEFEMRYGYARAGIDDAYHSLVFGTQDGVFYSRIILDSQTVYPVGAIYITTVSVSPASIFGGSWEKIEGRFLLGASTNYPVGSRGGEAEHTLTVDEMPAHSHKYGSTRQDADPDSSGAHGYKWSDINNTQTTLETGGDQPHNNMPPYYAVYIWQRTA